MLKRGFLAGVLLIVVGALAGCGNGDGIPFDGDWVSLTAGRLSFDDTKWWDGDGDSGHYNYWGDDPVYTIVFETNAGNLERTATFLDDNTFVLCAPGATTVAAGCDEFVRDKPTLH